MAIAAFLLFIPLSILLGLVAWLLPIPFALGLLAAAVFAVVPVFVWAKKAGSIMLRSLELTPAKGHRETGFINLVEGLSLTAGVAEPQCYVLEDQARNAMVVADDSVQALVVTRGLLESLQRVELEGVVAELLVQIKNGDAQKATFVSALFGQTILNRSGLSFLWPLVSWLYRNVLSAERSLAADRLAVGLTRYPPGLRDAFCVIKEGNVKPAATTKGNECLWCVAPSSRGPLQSSGSEIGLRIDVLGEL